MMEYNPKTNWKENDTVMPGDMNRIETGVKDAHGLVSQEAAARSEADTQIKTRLTAIDTELTTIDAELSVVETVVTATGTGAALAVTLAGKPLQHSRRIAVWLPVDIAAGATLDYNGSGAKPILCNDGQPIGVGAVAGAALNLIYSGTAGAWYLLDNAVVDTPQPLPEQIVNYKMLYYCGDECGVESGGWGNGNQLNGSPITTYFTTINHKINYLEMSGFTGAGGCATLRSGKINFDGFSLLNFIVDFKARKNKNLSHTSFGLCLSDYSYYPRPDEGYPEVIKYYSNKTVENASQSIYALDITGSADSHIFINVDNEYADNWLKLRGCVALKPDDYTAVLRAARITKSYANVAALVADTTAMATILSNERATRILTLTCTGDLMAAILQSHAWITAIKGNETARRIIMANAHWARFIAVIPTAEPLLNYTMLYDQGDEREAVTGGWAKNSWRAGVGTIVKNADSMDISWSNTISDNYTAGTISKINLDDASKLIVIADAVNRTEAPSCNAAIHTIKSYSQGIYGDSTIKFWSKVPGGETIGIPKKKDWYACDVLDNESAYVSTSIYALSPALRLFTVLLLKTDPFQPWLDAAKITKTYANLDTVLADENTLALLMSNEAAIEYMVSCSGTLMAAVCQSQTAMTALCNNIAYDKAFDNVWWRKFMTMGDVSLTAMDAAPQTRSVPAMTSDTTPAGMAKITTQYDGSKAAFKAFDKSLNTITASTANTGVGWRLSYAFSSPITPYKFTLLLNDGGVGASDVIRSIEIQASNDSENWHTLSALIDKKPFSSLTIINSFCAVSYQYFSVIFQDLSGTGTGYNYYASVTEFNVCGKAANQ